MPACAAASSTTPRAWPTANAVWALREKNSRSTATSRGRWSAISSVDARGGSRRSRSGSERVAAVVESSRSRRRGARRRSARRCRSPVRRSPGRSRGRSPGDLGEDLLGDVEVRASPAGRRRGPRAGRSGAAPGAPCRARGSTVCLAIIALSADSTCDAGRLERLARRPRAPPGSV